MTMAVQQRWRDSAPRLDGRVLFDEPLARHCTYQIGGPAAVLVLPASDSDVVTVLRQVARDGTRLVVLGAGSNVLPADEPLDAVVLCLGDAFAAVQRTGDELEVQAGLGGRQLALVAAAAGLTPFGFLYDIPGTVGGFIVQNAGMYDYTIGPLVVWVRHASPDGALHTTPGQELGFGYRTSRFKTDLAKHVIVAARLRATGHGAPAELTAAMEAVKAMRWSKFPMEFPNCGSVFKRPPGDYAGRLIQEAGCGGLRVGAAEVSRKHHNFIVNTGGASAADVRALIALVQQRVQERFGVLLERELVYLT